MTTPQITTPAPFPFATITTDSGTLTVPCEPINDWLAITPATGKTDDGRPVLGGTFTITHLATGATIADGDACINCCRASGRKLASLQTADWSALTANNAADWFAGLSEDDRHTLSLYRALEWGCDAEYCEIPAEARPVVDVALPGVSR
ncbi:hypothetical protein M2302_000303 [Micromonospora sp. A200]|uniref:hypothetical protein n=1 Tax=Micromonospora sp. A200 TaxID=2940568 RepID=UPI002473403B|nr:hypothetical protein [Micromonospora sp. A200]MDH6460152.1 hypothetical protein [Micromonospora sp. A200]